MPSYEVGYHDNSKRLRAWEAHYMAKGCTSSKARDVAWRKCFKSHTWPPDEVG